MKELLEKYEINSSENLDFFKSIFSGGCFDAENKNISADVIAKVLTTSELKDKITNKGLNIKNAIIDDELNLGYLKADFPIYFENTTFKEGIDLNLSKIESLFITNKCKVNKGIQLIGAKVDGQLNFKGSVFENPEGDAINAQNTIVDGHVFLENLSKNKFIAKGKVDLNQITIRGDLFCIGASFENTKKDGDNEPVALCFNRAKITGSVEMNNGFRAEGEVRFIGAHISGSLYCEGGIFCNPTGRAINAKMIKVGGDVFFDKFKNKDNSENKDEPKNKDRRFKAQGEVKLSGAYIAGQLRCCDSIFKEPERSEEFEYGDPVAALLAKGIKIDGPLFMNNIAVKGLIDLTDAKINGRFELTKIKKACSFRLILKSAFSSEFKDDGFKDEGFNWHTKGKLDLQDFTYDIISETELKERKKIKETIKIRIDKGFFPEKKDFSHQPYLQMAKIMEKSGYERGAEYLRIRMNDKKRKSNITFLQKTRLFFLKYLIGYGYKPFRVVYWAVPIWLLGVLLFSSGYKNNQIKPPSRFAWTDSAPPYENLYEHYTVFNPWIYSLDVFLPFVSLGQQEHWKPNSYQTCKISSKSGVFKLSGRILLTFVYIEILLGWFLASMLAIGISGLVKQKDD